MLSVIHTNIRKTAMPRTGRTLDALVTGASGAGGGSVAAQGEQYWEIVTVGPDGAQLAQEDYYLRPRQELDVVSLRNLIAYGDVIAKSVDEEIEDAELPKAGYGITNFGLTAIKQGGGLLVDSNNLVYIDPNYAGGGGLDIEQLEQYLTSRFYMKKNDPASYLLMTGYAMPETYAPVTSTDTVLTAIGKLERNFGNYVTIATQQTVTGKKTFTQDIIGQGDIIAKSASAAISDAELPIASKTQLGLIKIGSGFTITADGTLNNTGTGGISEVYWDDIKYPPTTLSGYGITASNVLTTLKTVDGSGSGLDADLLDGQHLGQGLNQVTKNLVFPAFSEFGTDTNDETYYKNIEKWVETNYSGKDAVFFGIGTPNSQGIIIGNKYDNTGNSDGFPQYCSFLMTRLGGSVHVFGTNNYKPYYYKLARTTDNVASATKLQTARTINGTSFNGTANITTAKWGTARNIYIRDASQAHTGAAVSVDGSANEYLLLPSIITASLSGNATTATKLQTARTIWGNSFNGSDNIGGTLTPLADNTYDLGTTSRRWRYLYFYGYNGNWVSGKTRAAINIESQNSSTSTYFPYLRIESKYGDVFNIGMLQSTSESNNQFGIFRFASDRTANGTDSSFYMRGDGNMYGTGTLTMNGDIIAKSTSSAVSDSELPIASSGQLGLIRIGSGLTINSSGVVSVTGGSGGGSNVYWGTATTNMVPLYVDGSYYELARNNHSHGVSTSGSGNAVTSISFSGRNMVLTKGSTFSLSNHTHSQYLTSHQRIYTLTIQKNGTSIGTYTPNSANKTINIQVNEGSSDTFNGGTITNALYINIPSGGATRAFKMRYGTGRYFIINNGGTPSLMANNADSYNSNANVTFDTSKVSAVGFTYTGTSDMRLKDKIGDITGVLDKLSGIEAFFFRYKADPNDIHIGVSAQEVIKVFPEVVPLIGDYYQLRYTDFLTAVSVNGIKELYALQKQTTNEIDALKRRVALLEAENQNLWNLINEKEAA